MRYFILKEDLISDKYKTAEMDPTGVLHLAVLYQLYNWMVIEVSETLWDIINVQLSGKILEIEKDVAIDGCAMFGEVRPYAKVFEAESEHYPAVKHVVDMTPELSTKTLKFMYLFAKEIIEDEYTKRFEVLRDRSPLEHISWQIQKQEAKENLADPTGTNVPFLDYISQERELPKDYLAGKIIEKATEFEDKMSTMLVTMQKLLKEFEECTTIRGINILYENYLGVKLPTIQAVEDGYVVAEDDWTRKNEEELVHGRYNF